MVLPVSVFAGMMIYAVFTGGVGIAAILLVMAAVAIYGFVFLGIAWAIVQLYRIITPRVLLRPVFIILLLLPPLLTFAPIYGATGFPDSGGIGPISLWGYLARLS